VVRPWVRASSFLMEINILPPAAHPEVNRTVASSLRNPKLARRSEPPDSTSASTIGASADCTRPAIKPGRPKRPHAPDRLRLARVAGRDPYRHDRGRDRKDIGAEPAMPIFV
jgi:hypothetical protein